MHEKLTVKIKTFYGLGDMATAAVGGVTGYLFNTFWLDVAGLEAYMVTLLLIIKGVWDAFNDPLMGQINDRWESRFGRRKSWILMATAPLAIFFFLSWRVPDLAPWGKFAYYTLVVILLDTFYTMHNVPYAALTAEMTDDYGERTRINMYRFAFSLFGSLLGTVTFALLLQDAADPQRAYFIGSVIVFFLILITGFAPALFTPEKNPKIDRSAKQPSFFENIQLVFQIAPFRQVILLFFLAWTAVVVVQTYFVQYLQLWLQPDGGNLAIMIVYLQLSAVTFVIFYGWLSKYVGKKNVYYIGGSIWALVFVGAFFLPQNAPSAIVIGLAILGGGGTAVALLVPYSMLPDVIDYDEAENGMRREGVFYGYFSFANKIGRSIALGALSYVLFLVGYQEGTGGTGAIQQSDQVLLTIRVFMSFVPAVLVFASFFVVRRYPITEAYHREILKELGRDSEELDIASVEMGGG